MDLSVLIPARQEQFLNRTIEDVLAQRRGATEIIVVLDGAWPETPIPDDPDVHLIYHPASIGQRAAVNEAARWSNARYIMKLDAHCALDEGFDTKLIAAAETLGPDVTQIPAQKNLHVFDRVCATCGTRVYQGPMPSTCPCGGAYQLVMVWTPRGGTTNTNFRFDHTLHFQYWRQKDRQTSDIRDVMTSIGACFFLARDRFLELGGLDERHGSWGNVGVEIACKSWLSGGRHVSNAATWFAHFFRVGGINFPYPIHGSEQEQARIYSRHVWMPNAWPQQVRPLSWLIEKFAPIPGWHDPEGAEALATVTAAGAVFTAQGGMAHEGLKVVGHQSTRSSDNKPRVMDVGVVEPISLVLPIKKHPARGLIYYSDCRGDVSVLEAVRARLERLASERAMPIVSVTLQPVPLGQNIVLSQERGILTMFEQILAGLEASTADVVFFTEHDVLYHPSHFDFRPPRTDRYYYNEHTYKVDAETGQALFYYTKQTSGLCASRALLLQHYRTRVERVRREGFTRAMGFEPGTHTFPRGVDTVPAERWMSASPNVDIRHGANLTSSRWRQDQFRNPKACQGWTLTDEVPGWGVTKGRFAAFLADVRHDACPEALAQGVG